MHTRRPSIDYLCGDQLGQVLQPQAGCFRFSVPELPRLDDLIGTTDGRADDGHGILQCDPWNGGIQESAHKIQGRSLFLPLVLEPPRSADGQMRAWWVGNHQIPSFIQDLQDVPLVMMWRIVLARQ